MRIDRRRLLSALFVLTVAAAVLTACSPRAAAQTLLRWKFREGQDWRMRYSQNVRTEIRNRKDPTSISVDMEMDLSWRIGKVDPQGVAEVRQTFDRIDVRMRAGEGKEIRYDSASPERASREAKDLAETLSSVVGAEFLLKLDSRGQVSDVRMPERVEALLKEAADTDAMKELFTRDGIKKMLGPSVAVLPEDAVSPGDTWNRTHRTLQQTTETTYRYDGLQTDGDRPLEAISVGGTLELAPSADDRARTVLKKQSLTGTIRFDNDAGRLADSTLKLELLQVTTYRERTIEVQSSSQSSLKVTEEP